MCFRDLIAALHRAGVSVTDSQVRWAITSDKINRPPLDGSLRLIFTREHLQQLKTLFKDEKERTCK